MATEFHLRVQRILEAVVRAVPTERERVLRAACADDTRVLREARSLLPHYQEAGNYEPPRPGGDAWRMPGTTAFLKARAGVSCADPANVEPKPPFTIDQYTVVEVIGRGGMGVVYRAVQPVLNREVAVKILRRRRLSALDRWRFAFEEEILRQLRHPGIARFSYSGLVCLGRHNPASTADDERPYFVMEYVRGQSLTRFAAAHDLDVRQRLALLAKVCDAVEYAHRRGIVHCDLKPDNILVDDFGHPKVVDFGIARIASFEGADPTAPHGIAGTPPYASPEQLSARAELLTPRSDVYALGVIAQELLTGHLPPRTDGRECLPLQCVCLDRTVLPGDPVNREFRYYLHRILATALRASRGFPTARRQRGTAGYGSAGELGQDLDDLLTQFRMESGWARLKNRLASRLAWPLKSDSGSLSRPLSAVLRKRIGMAIATNSMR